MSSDTAKAFQPSDRLAQLDLQKIGREIHDFTREAYPIARSITGPGVRETLKLLERFVPITVHEVATGTEVFDWQVPREWTLRRAFLRAPEGRIVADTDIHTLHVLNYSVPIRARLSLDELRPHLYSLPDQPEAIPYRTSYYQERWGFCLPHAVLETLPEGEYEVMIDSTLEDGHLTYGEVVLPGKSADTVLISTHICHPSLANDNLSGLGVCARLAQELSQLDERRYTYRFVFLPGTIGSITWLALNRDIASNVRHGLVAANLGDGGRFHYKKSRQGEAEIDRLVERVLADAEVREGSPYEIEDFIPFGYDERQYCSPGFNLAVGSLTRTPWGRYPQYHTSNDNLDFIRPEHLGLSLKRYFEVVEGLEHNRVYRNLNPHCEPQLGRRGLYRTIGGSESGREREMAILWVLNLSDGEHDLLAIAERSGISLTRLIEATQALLGANLLQPVARQAVNP